MMAETVCRLYLVVPSPSATIEGYLSQVLAATEIACVLHVEGKTKRDEAWDVHLRELAHQHEAAFLVEADAEHAKRVGADGVHIPADVPLYRRTRDQLGERSIVGVGCRRSRHDAMVLGELGADYIAFGPDDAPGGHETEDRAALIAWWAETVEVPCVAWGVETLAEAERLARLGADFVALSPSVWQAAEPARVVGEIGASLRRVRTAA